MKLHLCLADDPAPRLPPGDLDNRAGTVDVAIPELCTGTNFPEWLLERRKSSESALIAVAVDCN